MALASNGDPGAYDELVRRKQAYVLRLMRGLSPRRDCGRDEPTARHSKIPHRSRQRTAARAAARLRRQVMNPLEEDVAKLVAADEPAAGRSVPRGGAASHRDVPICAKSARAQRLCGGGRGLSRRRSAHSGGGSLPGGARDQDSEFAARRWRGRGWRNRTHVVDDVRRWLRRPTAPGVKNCARVERCARSSAALTLFLVYCSALGRNASVNVFCTVGGAVA